MVLGVMAIKCENADCYDVFFLNVSFLLWASSALLIPSCTAVIEKLGAPHCGGLQESFKEQHLRQYCTVWCVLEHKHPSGNVVNVIGYYLNA